MPLSRAYQAWDITGQAELVLSIADQFKNAGKGVISDPANTMVDVEQAFAPSHLFFTDRDLYYSDFEIINPPYVHEFLEFDDRAPYRGFYKRTEVGVMFPRLIKDEDVPKPGDPLV